MKDFYAILEVSRGASPEVIRAAYRAIAKKYHPDNKETGNQAAFVLAKEAHDTLLDPGKRALYDAQTAGNYPNGHQTNGQQTTGGQHSAPPQQQRVWVNGLGWVLADAQPQPFQQPFPNPNYTSYEDLIRNAAGGIVHNAVDMMVDELLQTLRNGMRRR